MKRERFISVVSIALGLVIFAAAQAEPPPNRLWIRGWNGPANHSDEPTAILALPDHSVMVAGTSYDPAAGGAHPALIRYDVQGNVAYSHVERGYAQFQSLHLTSTGDVLLVGSVSINGVWNVLLRRVHPADGSMAWEVTHPATHVFGNIKHTVVEDPATGTVLIASALAGDFLVVRYNMADGAFIDEHSYDGPQHGNDTATAIRPLPGGGYVVAGIENNSSGGYRTIAANPNGSVAWTDHENGPIGNTFTPAWLGVDAQGNVLVGGGPETTCGLFEFRAWKISPTGQRLWTRDWPTTNCASAEPADFAMGADGSIAMVGQTDNPNNIAVLHVDPNGVMWTRAWDGPIHGGDDGVAVDVDPAGNVIVAGSVGATGGSDIVAVGWSKYGDEIFSRIDAAQATGNDFVIAMSALSADSFTIASYAFGSTQNNDIYTSQYQRVRKSGDVNADGLVDVNDLLAVITSWGPCAAPPANCPADIAPPPSGDGQVNVNDLLAVISSGNVGEPRAILSSGKPPRLFKTEDADLSHIDSPAALDSLIACVGKVCDIQIR